LHADEVMANIIPPLRTQHGRGSQCSGRTGPRRLPLPSLRLSLVVGAHTAVEDTPRVALVVVVASPKSASHVAAWTTSCPPALHLMTPL
jgi:hypothetical protein